MDSEIISSKQKSFENFDKTTRRSSIKSENEKTVILATTNILEFRNFQLKKTYKKIVSLKNVSSNLARFQLERPKESRFKVFLEFGNNKNGSIAPGMSAKLIVTFRPDFYEEPEENIVIRIQAGKTIVLLVRAFRDPPILQGVRTLYHSCFQSVTPSTISLNTVKMDQETFNKEVVGTKQLICSNETLKFDLVSSETIFTTHFECGKCFIGELVIIPTTMRNIGESGKFFIISEVDWSSMKIEDVTINNTVFTPPFAFFPAYFILRNNEEITFQSLFFPFTYGVQVDKYFIIGDNCSVQPIEIIGDGIMFEEKFILFNAQNLVPEENEDIIARYCVELSHSKSENRFETLIEVFNTSGTIMHYHWEHREVNANDSNEERNWEHLSLSDIFINPKEGIFQPYSSILFFIFVEAAKLVADEYRTILRLCIEDIPLSAINKNLKLHLQDSVIKRRTCQVTVDIFIFEVEILIRDWLSNSFESRESMYYKLNKTDENGFQCNFSEKENVQSYGPEKCEKLAKSIGSIIEYQNTRSLQSIEWNRLNSEQQIAVLKPAKPLYIGIRETFFVVLRNLSHRHVIFEWGKIFGDDKQKLNIVIEPKRGTMRPRSIKTIRIFCEPTELDWISSFYIPCYSANMDNLMTLRVECFVESFNVSFLFPWKSLDTLLPSDELIIVNWTKNGNKIESDHKIVKYGDIQSRSENFIPEEFESFASEMENYSDEISLGNVNDCCSLTCFEERKYKSIKKSVIKFCRLSLKKAEKRIFLIRNNTGIVTNFSINAKNFFSLENENDENWDEIKQPKCGIVVLTKPRYGKIEPFEMKIVYVYAYADTWGEYNEEIYINIDGLPEFMFQVQIQVEDLPVSYPICRNLLSNRPILRFMKYDDCSKSRSLAIENTSCIPIIIKWHLLQIENDPFIEVNPLKLFVDIFAPFPLFDDFKVTDSREEMKNLETPFKSSLQSYESNPSFKELNRFNSPILTDRSSSFEETEKTESCSIIEKEESQKNELNVELTLLSDFNEVDERLLSIQPRELFIPPKEKRFITVNFNSNAPFNYYSSKIFFQAVGFIRISPKHKRDECFLRRDGCSISPTVIEIEIINVRPFLTILSPKSQTVFKFFANEFGRGLKSKKTIEKQIVLKNENQEALIINLNTDSPFRIKKVSNFAEKLSTKLCLQPGESIEVVLACTLNDGMIQEIVKDNEKCNDWLKRTTTSLLICYSDGCVQEIELSLQIYLPSIKLSTESLNFNDVFIGSSKELFLTIENCAVWDQDFQIERPEKRSEFFILPTSGRLSGSELAGRTLNISIIFQPTNNETLSEFVKITTEISGYELEFQIRGQGISS